jgi:hypothetical protein
VTTGSPNTWTPFGRLVGAVVRTYG